MKIPEEMMAYFKAMPKKESKPNPYWEFVELYNRPAVVTRGRDGDISFIEPLDTEGTIRTLYKVRKFFRRFYESFGSEAQVLCVTYDDAAKLENIGIPVLTEGRIGVKPVKVMVLPQDNHMGTSVISEQFWQDRIVGMEIKPVARIHSHHILDPYQSFTDYSTLNSGTLEMVIGRILEKNLSVCYWLDVPGTDIKAQTFLARENADGSFEIIPHKFHGKTDANLENTKTMLNSLAGLSAIHKTTE